MFQTDGHHNQLLNSLKAFATTTKPTKPTELPITTMGDIQRRTAKSTRVLRTVRLQSNQLVDGTGLM